jgi:predicted amidophosphoribosyltransferase
MLWPARLALGAAAGASFLKMLARGAADFLCPPACQLCGTSLETADGKPADDFCPGCVDALVRTRGRACLACGANIGPYLDPKEPCAMCHGESFAFERVIRLGVYDDELRRAIMRSKTKSGESLCGALGQLTWQLEREAFLGVGADVVVSVPRHRWRRLLHPHNAAETLAEVWASRLKVPLASPILRKVRRTRPQAQLPPSERRQNLRNAFAAASAAVAGATVLLADDVMTTGATAHEASKALKAAGAIRVVLAVVARGLGRR